MVVASQFREADVAFQDQFSRGVAVGPKLLRHLFQKCGKLGALSGAPCARFGRSYIVYNLGAMTAKYLGYLRGVVRITIWGGTYMVLRMLGLTTTLSFVVPRELIALILDDLSILTKICLYFVQCCFARLTSNMHSRFTASFYASHSDNLQAPPSSLSKGILTCTDPNPVCI